MKTKLLPRFLLLFLAMVVCSVTANATLKVTGWISDANDNYVADATVSICDASDTPLYSTTSDSWGDYVLSLGEEGLTGEYTLKVSAAGFAPASKTVTLTEEEEVVKDEDFVLESNSATISGMIYDASSSYKQISGAKLCLTLNGVTVVEALSEAWVGYTLKVVDVDPAEVYVLTVSKTGFDTWTKELNLTPGQSLDLTVKLYPEGTTPKPSADTEVSGTVKSDYDSSAISGATISLLDGEETLATATSDDEGNFKLILKDNTLSGEYTLTAAAEGYVTVSETVQITDGHADPVKFRLAQEVLSCKLTVNVTNEKNSLLSGVKGVLSLDGTTVATETSNWGIMEFEIDKVSADPYTLTLSLEGYQTIVEPDIELQGGEDRSLSFILEKEEEIFTTEVKGKTVDKATGAPLSGVRVALISGDDELDYEYTDAAGAFTITIKEKLNGEFTLATRLKGYAETKQNITITDGVVDGDITLELEKQYTTLDITVVNDATGKPVADAAITVEEQYDPVAYGSTDENGHCLIEFAAQGYVEYDLKVSCPLYNNYSLRSTYEFGQVNKIEVRLVPILTSIDTLETEGSDIRIYDMQGRSVKDLSAPGIYIVVRDGRRMKVVI